MRAVLLAAVVLPVFAGCGPKQVEKVNLSGTASYKGQRLTGGIIRIVGPGGEYAAGVVQADGTYPVTDVLPGEIKVGVVRRLEGGGQADPAAGRGAGQVRGPGDPGHRVHDHRRHHQPGHRVQVTRHAESHAACCGMTQGVRREG